MKKITYFSLCAVLLSASYGSALAHDPSAKTAGIPPEVAKRMLDSKTFVDTIDDQKKGIYFAIMQWPPMFTKLRVCFMGGSDATNAKVAEIAKKWESPSTMSLKLDFGKAESPRRCDPEARESQIRISYNLVGYYSALGTHSVMSYPQEEPSMNLEGFDKVEPSKLETDDFHRGIILHEFGHALGLHHEHQSPNYKCSDDLNWDYIIKDMQTPPNPWTIEQINWNMAVFVPRPQDRLMMTDFDPKSVMLYYFPPEYFKSGKASPCYSPYENSDISEVDRITIDYMYSADMAARQKNFEAARVDYMQAVERSKEKMTKTVGMDFMELYFDRFSKPVDAE